MLSISKTVLPFTLGKYESNRKILRDSRVSGSFRNIAITPGMYCIPIGIRPRLDRGERKVVFSYVERDLVGPVNLQLDLVGATALRRLDELHRDIEASAVIRRHLGDDESAGAVPDNALVDSYLFHFPQS